jgi:hypothetical protein
MTQSEMDALKYATRDRDLVACLGLGDQIEILQLKSGVYRAYIRSFVTQSPRGYKAETKEVVRDGFDYIITGKTRDNLISKLKTEYPGWRWSI